jgi:hypothetical protein
VIKKIMTFKVFLLFVFVGVSHGINNGLGRTPQMGIRDEYVFVITVYFDYLRME